MGNKVVIILIIVLIVLFVVIVSIASLTVILRAESIIDSLLGLAINNITLILAMSLIGLFEKTINK